MCMHLYKNDRISQLFRHQENTHNLQLACSYKCIYGTQIWVPLTEIKVGIRRGFRNLAQPPHIPDEERSPVTLTVSASPHDYSIEPGLLAITQVFSSCDKASSWHSPNSSFKHRKACEKRWKYPFQIISFIWKDFVFWLPILFSMFTWGQTKYLWGC